MIRLPSRRLFIALNVLILGLSTGCNKAATKIEVEGAEELAGAVSKLLLSVTTKEVSKSPAEQKIDTRLAELLGRPVLLSLSEGVPKDFFKVRNIEPSEISRDCEAAIRTFQSPQVQDQLRQITDALHRYEITSQVRVRSDGTFLAISPLEDALGVQQALREIEDQRSHIPEAKLRDYYASIRAILDTSIAPYEKLIILNEKNLRETAELATERFDLSLYPKEVNGGVSESTKKEQLRIGVSFREPPTEEAFQAAENILKASSTNLIIINLLPVAIEETQAWLGYSDKDLQQFVVWGRKVDSIIQNRGLKALDRIHLRRNLDQYLKGLNSEGQRNRVVIIIGEADGQGAVRLPTYTDHIKPSKWSLWDVPYKNSESFSLHERNYENVSFVGLFCRSSEALRGVEGLKVNGDIYADRAVAILRKYLSTGPDPKGATVGEVLDGLIIDATYDRQALLKIAGSVAVGLVGAEYAAKHTAKTKEEAKLDRTTK